MLALFSSNVLIHQIKHKIYTSKISKNLNHNAYPLSLSSKQQDRKPCAILLLSHYEYDTQQHMEGSYKLHPQFNCLATFLVRFKKSVSFYI